MRALLVIPLAAVSAPFVLAQSGSQTQLTPTLTFSPMKPRQSSCLSQVLNPQMIVRSTGKPVTESIRFSTAAFSPPVYFARPQRQPRRDETRV